MLRRVATLALLLTLALAGCSGDPGSSGEPDAEPEAFDDVQVTSTTGAIRGIVVSEAIVPIPGVLVALTDGRNQTTDDDGAFVFNGLESGDYFITASKATYVTQQAAATVVAGDDQPPITKILLPQDQLMIPFTTQQTWDGYVQCAFMVAGSAGAQLCGQLDDRFIHYFSMDTGVPDYAQAEMVWQSTQPVGDAMDLEFYDGGTWHHDVVSGISPLMVNATGEELADWYGENETEFGMRAWPSGEEVAAVTYNQQFTVFMTMFYNMVPRQGWMMIVDGACEPVESCM